MTLEGDKTAEKLGVASVEKPEAPAARVEAGLPRDPLAEEAPESPEGML